MPITDTVRAILTAAAEHPNQLAVLPERLPVAAKRVVIQSMVKAGLVEEVQADDDQPAWRTGEDGARYVLQATEAGLQAVGVAGKEDEPAAREPSPAEAATDSTAAPPEPLMCLSTKSAAQAVLTAWDDPADRHAALPAAIEALRAALSRRQAQSRPPTPRLPRADTKRSLVLGLLRRPEGATVAQVVDATGWARHTVHGFFAGLKTRGIPVEVLERVRQVGAGQGAKGSYTVYRVAEVG